MSVIEVEQTHAVSSSGKIVRARLLGDRIDTSGLERNDVLSTTPLTFRAGHDGAVTIFRYGVVVLFGLSVLEEDEVLQKLRSRVVRPIEIWEDEAATIDIAADKDEQILPGGPILVKAITPEHMVVIADALAKSVVLARDEREVSSVIDVIEPFARQLAEKGRAPGGRRTILKYVGNALLVQHRVSGRVAVGDKPDAVWDRPDLERLYARLQDEYELKERAEALSRKLAVISETAEVLTDMIDTKRSLRLETIIVVLILSEIAITTYQLLTH
ncbi:MAG TPA: RMD1 family protein [Xanthobacteraceae bacterium]